MLLRITFLLHNFLSINYHSHYIALSGFFKKKANDSSIKIPVY